MSTPLEQVSKIDFSTTLSDSWAGFKSKCGVLVGATIIYMILVGLLSTLPGLFGGGEEAMENLENFGTTTLDYNSLPWSYYAWMIPVYIVAFFFSVNLIRAAILIAKGTPERVSLKTFIRVDGLVTAIAISLITGVITTVVSMLSLIPLLLMDSENSTVALILASILYLPSLILSILLYFALYAFFGDELGIKNSLLASINVAKKNFWICAGLGALSVIVVIVSIIPFGLGLLITIPLITLWGAYAYREATPLTTDGHIEMV